MKAAQQPLIEYMSPIDSYVIKGRCGSGCISSMMAYLCDYASKTGSAIIVCDDFELSLEELQSNYPSCEISTLRLEDSIVTDIRIKTLLMYLNKPVIILYRMNRFQQRISWLYHLSHMIHKFGKELSIDTKMIGYHQLPHTSN